MSREPGVYRAPPFTRGGWYVERQGSRFDSHVNRWRRYLKREAKMYAERMYTLTARVAELEGRQ